MRPLLVFSVFLATKIYNHHESEETMAARPEPGSHIALKIDRFSHALFALLGRHRHQADNNRQGRKQIVPLGFRNSQHAYGSQKSGDPRIGRRFRKAVTHEFHNKLLFSC